MGLYWQGGYKAASYSTVQDCQKLRVTRVAKGYYVTHAKGRNNCVKHENRVNKCMIYEFMRKPSFKAARSLKFVYKTGSHPTPHPRLPVTITMYKHFMILLVTLLSQLCDSLGKEKKIAAYSGLWLRKQSPTSLRFSLDHSPFFMRDLKQNFCPKSFTTSECGPTKLCIYKMADAVQGKRTS